MSESVERIKKYTSESEILHRRVLAESRREESVRLIGKIESLVSGVLLEACEARKCLKCLSQFQGNGPMKIKSVGRSFLSVMRDFERVQEEYRERHRRQFERQCLLIDPSMSATDLAKLSDSQTSLLVAQQLFRLDSDPLGGAQRQLADMRDRNTEMQHLERGIEDIRVLFQDISVLVMAQGDLVSRVEDYVLEIQGNVDDSLQVLEKSVEVNRGAQRRRQLWFLISLIILIVLILIIFFG